MKVVTLDKLWNKEGRDTAAREIQGDINSWYDVTTALSIWTPSTAEHRFWRDKRLGICKEASPRIEGHAL